MKIHKDYTQFRNTFTKRTQCGRRLYNRGGAIAYAISAGTNYTRALKL